MEVLVDTSIWSLALRRNKPIPHDNTLVSKFSELISETRVRIIGPIRQELLSGIAEELQFQRLKNHLDSFEDLPIISKNYERAAEMHNHCKRKGISGGHIDFLICSMAEYYHLAIFTNDKDFTYYAKHLPITLYS
jgi:predicted nucleic acid-binding protein